MQKCIKCSLNKKNREFYKNPSAKSGYQKTCIKCYTKRVAKRAKLIYKYICKRKNKPCKDCGVKYLPCVMDFHHVRGRKMRRIALMSNYSIKKIDKEIDKCDLICANCHRIRHWEEMGVWPNIKIT